MALHGDGVIRVCALRMGEQRPVAGAHELVSSATPTSICSGRVRNTEFTCGVAAIAPVPSAAARRQMSSDSMALCGPSSIPARTWL